jgi:ferric-dicitrate binding protein FerR (iron transport regulator)
MDAELLKKYIANLCTQAETEEVFSWIQTLTDRSPSGETLLRRFWEETGFPENPDEGHSLVRLDRIHHRINLNQAERVAGSKTRFLSFNRRTLVWFVSYAAAILLIPVITLWVYTRFSPAEQVNPLSYKIFSPHGSRTYTELSDGTKVWLNHGSWMQYPQYFTGKTRTVQLSGEGYFEVAPNRSKPFVVEAAGMEVRAIGTAFNVKAYPDDTDCEATLKSGKWPTTE